jgi:serine/threonine protein kinase
MVKDALYTSAGYGMSALTGGMVSPTMAKRGMSIIGDYAGKKMDEKGIDGEEVAKKALHKTKHFFKNTFGKKKKKDLKKEEDIAGKSVSFIKDDTEDNKEEEYEIDAREYRLRVKKNVFNYYRMVKMLGAGAFGEVWKAVQRETGSHRAIKVIDQKKLTKTDKSNTDGKSDLEKSMSEIRILCQLVSNTHSDCNI